MQKDVIVVGGGIAGLTAALSLVKSGKKVLLVEKNDRCGGLMNTFNVDGFRFEGGARALVNAGLVKPLIEEFELDIQMLSNPITLGIEDRILEISGEDSLNQYADILKDLYPDNKQDVDRITQSISDIVEDMKVLYGVDNPLFSKEKKNIIKLVPATILWFLKFLRTMYRISKMDTPFEEHLNILSSNQSLKDIIGQHFFRNTPVFFALSYFALYNDYLYPEGGVGAFIQALVKTFEKLGGVTLYNTEVSYIDPKNKQIKDSDGNEYQYKEMIWAADLKHLYSIINDKGMDKRLSINFNGKKQAVLSHKGAESVFSVFLAVDLEPEYFKKIATGHSFYTPDRNGLGDIHIKELYNLLQEWDSIDEKDLYTWLERFCKYNTFEISIPVLRDSKAAPLGKTGVIISVLFDYDLTMMIHKKGWYDKFKQEFERMIIKTISSSIYPDLINKVLFSFSASPSSIYERVGSSEGSIVGWSFEKEIPVVSNMFKMGDSVKTEISDIYTAGKWVYSPAGGPTAIMTGRIAAKKCSKS